MNEKVKEGNGIMNENDKKNNKTEQRMPGD